jgi:hypothetical protein
MTIKAFCNWLSATPASELIQNVNWIIPSTQSIHILSIAILIAAVVTIDLRLVGVTKGGPSLIMLEKRFLPWFWTALAVLFVSGSILVIGEPSRELMNWVFLTKMALVLSVIALTTVFQRRIRADAGAWEATASQRAAAMALGGASLVLILGILTAGRWIAYVVV